MPRKQSLRKLGQAVLEKVADLTISSEDDISPYMPDRLRELATAAQLVAEGRYGKCVECNGNIPLARLQAKPEAVRCVRCQEKHEHVPAYHINPHVRSAS
ncbi:MAG: hypothetical protein GC159_02905 [Phycisphaera sp.]|nr:hypothetical protein [Phycisphaera sp.]